MNSVVKLVLSVGAGIVYFLAFPAIYFWPGAFIAIVVIVLIANSSGFRAGLLYGFIFFATFFALLIQWLTLYLGPVPWIALTLAMTLSGMIAFAIIMFVWKMIGERLSHPVLAILMKALSFASIWITWEAISSRFPFGGFSWGRFSFSQSESLWTTLFSYLGSAGVGFILIFFTVLISLGVIERKQFNWNRLSHISVASTVVAVFILLPFLPAFGTSPVGSIRVAAVQGNADAALNSKNVPGTVLNNHMEETLKLLGNQEFDLLVWPENASDLDPLRNDLAKASMDYLAELFQVPIVVGTITKTPEDVYYNSALVWGSGGLEQQYDKIHPVPFAEYMPMREFFMALAPDLVSLVTRDYEIGERLPVFDFEDYRAGVAICYDIADDEVMRTIATEDSQIILAPTNNADFGQTDQNVQQLAIAKIRALEARKAVVNISTVGTSAIIDADGTEINRLAPYVPGHMVNDVPLYSGQTMAITLGIIPEIMFGVVTILFLGAGVYFSWPLRLRK